MNNEKKINTGGSTEKNTRIKYRRRRYYHPRTNQTVQSKLENRLVSIIIPIYNEEDSVIELSIILQRVLNELVSNYEVIFVDDGSSDSSFEKIREIHHLNKRFKCIKFRRNYGKSAALSFGFKTAKGEIIITMDGDLQDEPEEVKALITKLNEGYDLVTGWKRNRKDPFLKRYSSKLFNFVTSLLVGIRLHDFNCGLKAYKKEVVKSIKIYGELHRYIPALAYLSGYKVTEIPVLHHTRKYGKTKYGASRFFNGLFDLITVLFTTKYIRRPLHFFGLIGLFNFVAGIGILTYLTILKFVEHIPISSRPLFFIGIFLAIVGMQFVSLGLIGEMITKTTSDKDNIITEQILW